MNGKPGTLRPIARRRSRLLPAALLALPAALLAVPAALLAVPAALLGIVGCANSTSPTAQLARLEGQGRELFVDHCALCHGDDARGDGALPGLMTPAADLTRIAARRGGDFPSGEIARFIDGRIPIEAHRSPEMPVWGLVMSTEFDDRDVREEVTRGKISALVWYLRSIQVE